MIICHSPINKWVIYKELKMLNFEDKTVMI